MKAKTLMGMIACAGACAVSVNVLATDLPWFDGKVSDTTESAISTPSNATWNASLPSGVITTGSAVINLDNDSTSPLVLTPNDNTEPTLSDGVVTVSATAILTPSAVSDLEAIENAKAGFAVGTENGTAAYYGFAAGLAVGDDTGWVKLAGVVPPATDETATSFKIVLDYRTGEKKVKFFVGSTQLNKDGEQNTTSFPIGSNVAGLQDVAAYGSGSISALAATCEKAVAVATVDGAYKKFGSAVEALAAADAGTTLKDVASDGTPTATQQASNGLFVWECDVLNVEENAQVALQPAGVENDYIKLALSVAPDEGASVTFNVVHADGGDAVVSGCSTTAITIPATASGKYKIVPVITKASN